MRPPRPGVVVRRSALSSRSSPGDKRKKSRSTTWCVKAAVFVVGVMWTGLLAAYSGSDESELAVDPIPIEEAAAAIEREPRSVSDDHEHLRGEKTADGRTLGTTAGPERREEAQKTPNPAPPQRRDDESASTKEEKPGVLRSDATEEEEDSRTRQQQPSLQTPKEEGEEAAGTFAMERDPRTNLFVPIFWNENTVENPMTFPTEVIDGEPTIFLMIASYRDFQCRDSISSALQRALKPNRLIIAAVQQNKDDDVPCNKPETPCDEDPTHVLCVHAKQIKIYEMDAREATGPVYARHVGARMYRGEAFAMQIDAHCAFANNWDEDIIEQWRATGNEMAVLSTYLTDVQGSLTKSGDSKRNTRPIMCNSDFEGRQPARYLRHNSQPEAVPAIPGIEPMLQPFWAAGFSFSRGHFVVNVKYDCCLPMVFMGEEISIGVRGWTHGYDFYAPSRSVVFHEYAQNSQRRRHVPKFWESASRRRDDLPQRGDAQSSLKRLTALIGMAPDVTEYDKTECERYGLGTKRDVADFYRLFLVDVEERAAQPLCRFVESGEMHREFHVKHRLRSGIDYDALRDFDTEAVIERRLYAPLKQRLTRAIERQDKEALAAAVNEASRVKLAIRPTPAKSAANRDLLQRARELQGRLMQSAP